MKRILLITFMLVSALMYDSWAQTRSVTGKVTSVEDGTELPGVNVVLQGTTTGTVTDIDGNYTLNVPEEGGTLVFSFIGLISQEVAIGNRSVVDVQMESDVRQLNEVVVTAVGIEREERALGYGVEKVDGEQVQQVSEPDALRALEGKVAGVNIIGSSGVAGSSTRITIRGNSSFLGNNQPLFVVDGIPFDNSQYNTSNQLTGGGAYGSRISDLDPNNIESMTVLKGGAAAALYGSRAANGVVLITTKSGSSRASKKGLEIAYTSSYALEEVANLPDYQNTYGAGTGFNYSNVNGSWGAPFSALDSIPHWYGGSEFADVFPEFQGQRVPYRAYPDNVKDFFETGSVFENSINITGGNENSVFSAVVSRLDQEGFIPFSSFERTNLSLGGNTILANKLNVGGNFSYINSVQIGPAGGANNAVGNASAFGRTLFPARNWDLHGQPFENPIDRSSVFFVGTGQSTNPLWSVRYDGFERRVDRFVTSLNADYDILDWLNISYKIGLNTYTQRGQEWFRPGSRGADGLGQVIDDDITYQEVESNLVLSATRELGEDFSLRAIIGHNVNQRTTDRQSVAGLNMIDFNIIDLDNTNDVTPNGGEYTRRRLYGIFADATLGYKDYVFLTLTGRNDWSSTLPSENQSFFYPAASLAFLFTDAFNINSNFLTSGKIRASVSKVGNDADPYSLAPVYNINRQTPFASGGNELPFLGVPGATFSNFERDPNLTPEFTTEYELGADLLLFNGRVGIDATVYDRRTTDQIANVSLPLTTGFSSFTTNFGEMSNRGVELGLDLTPISLDNGFKWNLYGTFTHNKNVVESLTEGTEEITLQASFTGSVTAVLRPGEEYGILRGTVNARDDEGNLLIDQSTGLLIPELDQQIIGNPNPDFIAGLTNTFSYKGFTLGAVFSWRQGGDFYSTTIQTYLGRGVTTDTEDREVNKIIPGVFGDPETREPIRNEQGEKIPNNIQVEENALWFGSSNSFAINGTDEWSVFDGTTFRLRELSLGYRLPEQLLDRTPFGSASITFTGRNLWYFAPNVPEGTNFDPEVNTFGNSNAQGLEFTSAPSVKRYGVNLRFTF